MSRKGLSLIELLVVVAILAVVAGMVVSMTDNLDSRTRYDDTARRLAEIRSAILGPDAVSADGQLLSGGFLQDVGRLPAGDGELLRPPAALKAWMESHGTNELLQYDATWKTWYGWRGPYVAAPPKRNDDAASRLYDGWGNEFQGWALQDVVSDRDYAVWSLGADGKAGGTGFAADCPDVAAQPLIAASEWESNWQGLQVKVVNASSGVFSASNVRFRIVVPDWEKADPFAFDAGSELVGGNSIASLNLDPGEERAFDFNLDATRYLRVSNGRRMLFLVDGATGARVTFNGNPVCCELKVSKRLSPRAELIVR